MSREFQLSDQPTYGTWTILVHAFVSWTFVCYVVLDLEGGKITSTPVSEELCIYICSHYITNGVVLNVVSSTEKMILFLH